MIVIRLNNQHLMQQKKNAETQILRNESLTKNILRNIAKFNKKMLSNLVNLFKK